MMNPTDERYHRQVVLSEFGLEAQAKLIRSRVLIAGIGGLGSPAALYLAAAGVGSLDLLDDDWVLPSNLNRQILHWTRDTDRLKVESAREKLEQVNPGIAICDIQKRLESYLSEPELPDYDLVLDCLDGLPGRFALNDYCVHREIPLVHGGAIRFTGQITSVDPGRGPCLRCFLPDSPEQCTTCDREGILGPVTGMIGTMQAMEAIKLLTGAGKPLIGRLLLVDGLAGQWTEVPIERDPDCPVCGRLGMEKHHASATKS